MKTMSLCALALTGALVASAGAHAAENDASHAFIHTAAVMGPSLALAPTDEQHEVIQPPASIDPGMALDPPQTRAKMPIIHPPGTPGGRLVLPH